MGQVFFSRRALEDLERFVDFRSAAGDESAAALVALLFSALEPLGDHPYLGRPVEHGLREAVISRGKTGYVALYRVDEVRGRVVVLTLRHQREAGFTAPAARPRAKRAPRRRSP